MKSELFKQDETVILAISGGRDSMCLLDMYYKKGQSIVVCHTNHHQREASETEEKYITEYCKERNIPLEIDEYFPDSLDNFQANAHVHRYEFFYETAKKYHSKYILTAHHKDDQAETIILRLIQGSNLYGYGGISRLVKYKDVYLYRPLLDYSRKEITDYCKANNVYYFDDESNSQNHYLRNRIRHQILPMLEAENPNILNTLMSFSNICKDSFNYIRNEAIKYLEENGGIIHISNFRNLDIALKKDIICYMLEENNISTSYQQITDVLELIESDKPQLDYNIRHDFLFYKRYNDCYFKAKEEKEIQEIKLNLNEAKTFNQKYLFTLTKDKPLANVNTLKICYNNLHLPLVIRTRKQGDEIKLKYGTKKLKNLFIDKKISHELRDTLPIVCDSDGNILWVYSCVKKPVDSLENVIYLTCEENYGK